MTPGKQALQEIAGLLTKAGWTNPPHDSDAPSAAEFSAGGGTPDFAAWERMADAWRAAEVGELKTETERALWDIVKMLQRAILREASR